MKLGKTVNIKTISNGIEEVSYTQEGFTLIELLVGINLGFLLLALLTTAYLFTVKFTSLTTERHNNDTGITTLLNRVHSVIQKSDEFYFVKMDSTVFLIIDDADTILITNNKIQNTFLDDSNTIDGYEIKLITQSGNGTTEINSNSHAPGFSSGQELIPFPVAAGNKYSSQSIKRIELSLLKKNKKYNLVYVKQLFGIKNFKNMEKGND